MDRPGDRLHNRLDEAQSARDLDKKRQAIEAAAAQSRELLDIFGALLRIAEVEALSPRAHFQDVALDQLVDELIETYRPDMEVSGHLLVTPIAPEIWTTGDRRFLRHLLTNLLDNALGHTPPGTTVRVELERNNATARLTVAGDGPGVASQDAARLFQRFARAERSRSSEGHGLGLALVAAVAAAHRGTVSLLASPGFGVIVELPVEKT